MAWCQTQRRVSMALILLLAVSVVACSATQHHYNIPVNTPLVLLQRRGGAVETPAGGNNLCDYGESSNQRQHRRFWYNLGALFELSANAKDQALEAEPEPLPPGNGGRGGALTVVKPKRRFLSISMSPPTFLLADKKEPLKEELLVIPKEPAKEPKQSMSGISRLWWVNARETMYDIGSDETKEQDTMTASVTIAVMDEEDKSKKSKPKKKDAKQKNKNKRKDVEETLVRDQVETKPYAETIKDDNERTIVQSTGEVDVESIQAVEERVGEGESTNKAKIYAKAIKEEETSFKQESVDQKSEIDVVTIEEKLVVEVDQSKDLEEEDETELDPGPAIVVGESPYISSGAWEAVDYILSLGLGKANPQLRVSRHLRPIRKAVARATGLHGTFSRKPKQTPLQEKPAEEEMEILDEEDLGLIRRRIAAIDRARRSVELKQEEDAASEEEEEGWGMFGRRRKLDDEILPGSPVSSDVKDVPLEETTSQSQEDMDEEEEARQRQERVLEIDRLITHGQKQLLDLACEKDALQRRPNPLYNYTTTQEEGDDNLKISRTFNFPSESLVEDYLDDLFAHGRLIKMNHTHLWKSGVGFDDDEDESIGDDLLTPSADVSRLYSEYPGKTYQPLERRNGNGNGNGGGGSWILRQSIGKGGSLGEKIGETAEIAGYKAVCNAVMASLARSISALHGINIMAHSDIRLFMEQIPDLPPISRNALPRNDYAEEAIKGAMMKSRKRKKKGGISKVPEEAFIQRDAVVETLLSHCQISAPLLKLFPLAWQRALLANMITLITHVISDFAEGIELQILGHALTFSFKPITESDMIRHIGLADKGVNHRRAKPEEFEAAVQATAEDVSQGLKILDRWHERALGSGMLRAQLANLIARLVLTLADEVLSGARMDLWAAQAGGPRVLAGLEYRSTPTPPIP